MDARMLKDEFDDESDERDCSDLLKKKYVVFFFFEKSHETRSTLRLVLNLFERASMLSPVPELSAPLCCFPHHDFLLALPVL